MIKILLIEDDEEMCEEFTKILKNNNYSVDAVYDGKRGIQAIERDGYNIVLLDLKMPGINGYEVLSYIRKKYPSTNVLVLTGSPINKEAVQEAFLYKDDYKDKILRLADSVINKPFDVKEVLSKIKELVNKGE